MSHYEARRIVVQAFKCGVENPPEWFCDAIREGKVHWALFDADGKPAKEDMIYCRLETLDGMMNAYIGDHIIKGTVGELYPCRPAVFESTFMEMER